MRRYHLPPAVSHGRGGCGLRARRRTRCDGVGKSDKPAAAGFVIGHYCPKRHTGQQKKRRERERDGSQHRINQFNAQMRLSDRRHFSFSTPIPRILTSFLRDLGNTTTPPSPAHGIAPLHSISRCNSGEAHLFPSASKPPRFLPSIAQKAISASSFGHHQFQPRAKNDTRLQPKGGAPPPRKPINL